MVIGASAARIGLSGLLLGAALTATSATAQSIPSTAPAQADSVQTAAADTQVGEVVVTATSVATLGAQPILDTPRTVEALGANLIQNFGNGSFQEVAKLFPSLTPTSPYSTPENRYFIRGGDSDNRRDGLPVDYIFLPVEEIDRFEVLQGVTDITQGGEKPPTGVVNVVPKHALPTPLASFTGGVNEYGGLIAQADLNQPFDGGRYGVRANFGTETLGYPDGEGGHRYAAALAFRANLTPRLTLDLNGHYQDQRQHDETYGYFGLIANADGSSSLPRLSYDKDYGEPWANNHWRIGTAEARLAGDLGGGWSIIAAAQVSRLSLDQLHALPFEIDPTGAATLLAQTDRSRVDDDAARVAITRSFDLGPNVTNKVAGLASYTLENLHGYFINTFVDGTPNIYGDFSAPRPVVTPQPSEPENGEIVKTAGVADELTLFQRLTLQGGVSRYDLVQKNYDATGAVSGETGLRLWLPSASALLKIDPSWTAYFTFTKSAETGGTVGGAYANAGAQLPAIQATTYEVGTKYQLGRLLLTGAAYTYTEPTPFVNADNVQTVSGASRFRGLDFEAQGYVTRRLSVVAGLSVIDAKVLKADDPTTLDKQPVNVPKISASLYAEYQVIDGLFLTGGAFHVDRKPVLSDDSVYAPGYTTFDVGARYETRLAEHKAVFRLTATNLTDKFYFASGNFGLPQLGTPRDVKASVTFDY